MNNSIVISVYQTAQTISLDNLTVNLKIYATLKSKKNVAKTRLILQLQVQINNEEVKMSMDLAETSQLCNM